MYTHEYLRKHIFDLIVISRLNYVSKNFKNHSAISSTREFIFYINVNFIGHFESMTIRVRKNSRRFQNDFCRIIFVFKRRQLKKKKKLNRYYQNNYRGAFF